MIFKPLSHSDEYFLVPNIKEEDEKEIYIKGYVYRTYVHYVLVSNYGNFLLREK